MCQVVKLPYSACCVEMLLQSYLWRLSVLLQKNFQKLKCSSRANWIITTLVVQQISYTGKCKSLKFRAFCEIFGTPTLWYTVSWPLFIDVGLSVSKPFALHIPGDNCAGICSWHLDLISTPVVPNVWNEIVNNNTLGVNKTPANGFCPLSGFYGHFMYLKLSVYDFLLHRSLTIEFTALKCV